MHQINPFRMPMRSQLRLSVLALGLLATGASQAVDFGPAGQKEDTGKRQARCERNHAIADGVAEHVGKARQSGLLAVGHAHARFAGGDVDIVRATRIAADERQTVDRFLQNVAAA